MRIIYWPLILLLVLTKTVDGQIARKIVWEKSRLLTWADFAGQPYDSALAVAATFCSIETLICKQNFWTGRITMKVEATFYPDTSWYLTSEIHGLTLRHEQGHFDIAEWFSRKLRKIIKDEIKFVKDYNQKFSATYGKLYQEYFTMQKRYETETKYGTDSGRQVMWENTIRNGLTSFDTYINNGCPN